MFLIFLSRFWCFVSSARERNIATSASTCRRTATCSKRKRWKDADDLRQKYSEQGFEVRDRNDGFDLFPIA